MTAKPEDLIHDLRREGEWFHGTARFDKSPLCQEAADLIEELLAQNRRLQEELNKAKADLGARNRILTEEP